MKTPVHIIYIPPFFDLKKQTEPTIFDWKAQDSFDQA